MGQFGATTSQQFVRQVGAAHGVSAFALAATVGKFRMGLIGEKASGEAVPLKEYLEQVWAAVANEALTMVFAGADTTGVNRMHG